MSREVQRTIADAIRRFCSAKGVFGQRAPVVQSWFGWPVPAVPRAASRRQIADLIEAAKRNGYSRKGAELGTSATYVLVPYLYEASPAPSWICLVIWVADDAVTVSTEDAKLLFSRLDVAVSDFSRLRRVRRRLLLQMFHWLALDAARR